MLARQFLPRSPRKYVLYTLDRLFHYTWNKRSTIRTFAHVTSLAVKFFHPSIFSQLSEGKYCKLTATNFIYSFRHEAKEENNGYVVFRWNVHGTTGEEQCGMWGGNVSPSLHPFVQQASGQILKDDVNGFSSTLDIFFLASENFPNSAWSIVHKLPPSCIKNIVFER